jgi:hypothetical protein
MKKFENTKISNLVIPNFVPFPVSEPTITICGATSEEVALGFVPRIVRPMKNIIRRPVSQLIQTVG